MRKLLSSMKLKGLSIERYIWERFCAQMITALIINIFSSNGIVHHYRIKHKQDFTSAERRESTRICNDLHQQETRKCMETIFEYRRRKVRMVKNVNLGINIHVCQV